jgi:hypothetical protein
MPLSAAPVVSARQRAGASGTDRVTLILPDGSVRDTWLKVTVLATERTGLPAPTTFYFGNLVGDANGDLRVNALDLSAVKRALNTASDLTGPFDFNRDGRVNALDLAAVRGNLNHTLRAFTAVPTVPVPPAAFVPAPAASLARSFTDRRVWDESAVPIL